MKKILVTIVAFGAILHGHSQTWFGNNAANSLYSINSTLALTPIKVGIGTNAPTEQFHTTAGVRFAGLTQDTLLTNVLVRDSTGKLFYRNAASVFAGNFWSLIGNTGTTPGTGAGQNYLGTTDGQRVVFATDATERMTIMNTSGYVGIGNNSPYLKLQVNGTGTGTDPLPNVDNAIGVIDDRPYDAGVGGQISFGGVFDGSGDHTTFAGIRGIKLNATDGNYSGQLEFYTRDNGVNSWTGAQRMVIDNAGNVGIGTSTPSAQLHTTGGVRFAGLTQDTTLSRVLVSDNSGNLFYKNISGIASGNFWSLIGNTGTTPGTGVGQNYLGTTDGQRVVFATDATERMTIMNTSGYVGIGNNNPYLKLQVNGAGTGTDPLPNVDNAIGVIDDRPYDAGVGGQISFGGVFDGSGDHTTFAGIRGVKLNATDGDYSGQLEFYTRDNGVNSWTGAQRMVIDNAGNVGIGMQPGTYTSGGTFTSNASAGPVKLDVNGLIRATSLVVTSDGNLKTNIKDVTDATDIINKLRPASYQWKDQTKDALNHYGFIAQEVEKIIPDAVITDNKNEKAVNYIEIIPLLTKAIQEQQAQITLLTKIVDSLKTSSGEIGQYRSSAIAELNVVLSNKDIIVLGQNAPNPFSEKTIIAYNIPQTVQTAQLQFSNLDGKIINTVNISEKGKGIVNVYADNLASGNYFYTLIIDGKIIETKQMIVTQ